MNENQEAQRRRILITGGSGRVGTAICQQLREKYSFRVLDVKPPADPAVCDDLVIGDAADFATVLAAAEGVNAVIHLARVPVKTDRTTQAQRAQFTFQTDIPSTWNALEAARLRGAEVVVYASSNHITGLNEQDGIRSAPELPVRPDGVYGAGKAFGEAMGRYYADRLGVRVCCIRIANFNGKEEPGRRYETGESRWLSPRDLGQLVRQCIDSTHVQFGIFYGVSNGAEKIWDITNARKVLGYVPEDDGASDYWREKYQD